MVEGFVHHDFSSVADLFQRQIRRGRPGTGASLTIYHRGEKVVDCWAGEAGEDRPWREDTVAMCFSTSKGVASTALHVCADRGLVDYETPVAKYWPEFAAQGKENVTVRHVLSHSAGLHGVRVLVDRAERILDWDFMTDALAAARPAYVPGSRSGYHALTYGWLVGEIVRRVSARPIEDFVREEIVEPLGLDGMWFGLPEAERHRAAEMAGPMFPEEALSRLRWLGTLGGKFLSAVRSPVNTRRMVNAMVPHGIQNLLWDGEIRDAVIPSANGFFTARSLARMYAVLAQGGGLDGVDLMSRDTVRAIGEIQTRRLDLVVVMPMRWRLGYHMVGTTRGILPHAFGHYGYGGSGAFADPSRELAMAFVPNSGGGTPMGDLRLLSLGAAAVSASDRRRWPRRRDTSGDLTPRVRSVGVQG